MNTKKLFASLAIAFAMTLTFALWAQEPAPPATPADPVAPVVAEEPPLGELTAPAAGATVPEVSPPVEAVVTPESPSGSAGKERARRNRPRSSGDAMVVFNRDAELPAGSTRDAVVSIGGSSTAYGDVAGAVVSIMGDSRADGTVGDVVVSILGNTTVNGRVDTAIAVFGGVRLGPNAEVKDVISVGGPIERAPGAKVTGQAQEVGFLDHMPNFTGFRAWIRHALFWGRPLAVADNLGWAWGVAAVFFGLYLALALLFPKAVESGLETIETRPGRTVLAAPSQGSGWRDLIVKTGGGGAPVRAVTVSFSSNGYAGNAIMLPVADAAVASSAASIIQDTPSFQATLDQHAANIAEPGQEPMRQTGLSHFSDQTRNP